MCDVAIYYKVENRRRVFSLGLDIGSLAVIAFPGIKVARHHICYHSWQKTLIPHLLHYRTPLLGPLSTAVEISKTVLGSHILIRDFRSAFIPFSALFHAIRRFGLDLS